MDLGLSEEETWSQSPRNLVALMDRLGELREAESERLARMAGEIAAATYNVNRDTEKNPNGFGWRDIFPEYREEESEEQTGAEMSATLRAFAKDLSLRKQ